MADKGIAKKIAALGRLCGITSQYRDNFGRRHRTSQATYRDLLSAMRVPWEDPERLDQEIARRRLGPWGSLVEPVQFTAPAPSTPTATVRVWSPTPEPRARVDVQGEIVSENGERNLWEKQLSPAEVLERHRVPEGFRIAFNLPLPGNLEIGYYDLTLRVRSGGREETGRTRLIAAPSQTYAPDWLKEGHQCWGLNLPLYAIKSRTNWGVGDFADLMAIMRWAGPLGAEFVGVNPLHAASANNADSSPYSPTSRVFFNTIYLNLEMATEMSECRKAQELVASQEFQARKTQLADAALVPYEDIRSLKRQVLDLLYQTFCRLHGDPKKPHTARGQEFAQYIAAKGDALIRFGRFNALADHLREGDWRRWPIPYQDPDGPAVMEFVRKHSNVVGLFQYGQWLAATQLTQVCQAARDQGLSLTLYQDLAVGTHPGGFETWTHQDLFAQNAAIGAPADAFNPGGQNWGLAPLIPERLRASGYQLFIDTLHANIPPGGMLRMDHAMGLFRLLWVPRRVEAQGAYVRYPDREMLAILALESMRRGALIIGEDLGTVPPRIHRELRRLGVFSYRVFYFERNEKNHFLPPEEYPSQAMAAVTTHDLPTLTGYWQGNDLVLKRELNLYPPGNLAETDAAARVEDRRLLLAALKDRELLSEGTAMDLEKDGSNMSSLREAVLTYLAQSRAALMEVRLEDIFGVTEQQNLPGTTREHPNWRIKLPLTLEQMAQDPGPARIAARLNKARRQKNSG